MAHHFDVIKHIVFPAKDDTRYQGNGKKHNIAQVKWDKFEWKPFHMLIIIYALMIAAGIIFNLCR